MSAPARPRRRLLRLAAVAGLLSAAFWASLPWLGCVWGPPTQIMDLFRMRVCTFGIGVVFERSVGIPGFNGPYWGYLIVGIAYVVSALFVARTRRSL